MCCDEADFAAYMAAREASRLSKAAIAEAVAAHEANERKRREAETKVILAMQGEE